MYLFDIEIMRNSQKEKETFYINLDIHKRLIISCPRLDNTDPDIKKVLRVVFKVLDRRIQLLMYSPTRSDFNDMVRGSMKNVEIELNDAFYNDPTCYKLGARAYNNKTRSVPRYEPSDESDDAIFSTMDDNTSLSDIL